MGELSKAINVADVCNHYDIKAFLETGTGDGLSVKFVDDVVSDIEIHTIEFVHEIFEETTKNLMHDHTNINFHFGSSKDRLKDIVPNLNGNVLFWLDAHFPGADYGLAGYGDYKDDSLRIPLEIELSTICELRDVSNDVFVMDDLRIYEDGPFQSGNWGDRNHLGGVGIDFVYDLLGDTHRIEKSYVQQGFIIGWPI